LKLSTSSKKRLKTIFINKQEQVSIGNEKVNIVLSPTYYWFKSEILPVKSIAQAKKLAPSVFDGTIPESEYSYHVIKKDDTFWLFAYNDAMIVAKLSQLGIKAAQINHIYFAQSECENLIEALKIDDSYALVVDENILSMVPLQYLDNYISVEEYFSKHDFSKSVVSLNFFQNNLIDEKYIYRFIAVILAFIAIYFASYILLRNDLKQVLKKEYEITQKYKLPATSFELNGLKRSLHVRENTQIKLRKSIKRLISLSLEKGEYIKKLTITQKKASYIIVMKNAKRAEAIKSALKKSFKINSAKVIDKTFYVGVTL
jgi:hypothetical protein